MKESGQILLQRLAKCHNCWSKVVKHFSKIIYIVRNPFDTFFAEFTRKHTHKTDTQSKHVVELGSGDFGK